MVLQAYRTEKVISTNKTLKLTGLPFASGDRVEVLIVRKVPRPHKKLYPLRGQGIHYERPFESVVETDWEALQ